jgi:hypothetical protein
MSSRRSRLPSGRSLCCWCTDKASQPGRMCRNVIDVDETPIKITIADTVMTARLADNATARDLAAQLPLTLTFKDFNHVREDRDPPRRLSMDGVPAGADPDIGDRLLRPVGRPGLLLRRRRLLERHRPQRPIRHHGGADRAPSRQLQGHDRTQLITRDRPWRIGQAPTRNAVISGKTAGPTCGERPDEDSVAAMVKRASTRSVGPTWRSTTPASGFHPATLPTNQPKPSTESTRSTCAGVGLHET